ncbi:hypothetical protein DPMN_055768 [Dreissena polymorpha]|uniref:Uncharacterized protein n=1 Tax=Dreissena polymorpha TaxID=45954 RepID=A0A9D4HT03_DREPO|nr:hypothetical protein DPMN_055768 [Dreissena polymorpha]
MAPDYNQRLSQLMSPYTTRYAGVCSYQHRKLFVLTACEDTAAVYLNIYAILCKTQLLCQTLVLVQQFPVTINPDVSGPINLLAAFIFTVDPIVYILARKTNYQRLRTILCTFCY